MSVLDSLLTDVFGLSIVFVVLIVISLLIKLISIVFGKAGKTESAPESQPALAGSETQIKDSELELIDIDEKTAALVMAIVSKNTNIPLSRLQFTSIKLVK